MPCSDSSSSMVVQIDSEENFLDFRYAKITCGREINGKTSLSKYLLGKPLQNILELDFSQIVSDLKLKEEESQFILYLEWDALRCAIGEYLGIDSTDIDTERCRISSIEQKKEGTEISLIILPPQEMPKILPCHLGDN